MKKIVILLLSVMLIIPCAAIAKSNTDETDATALETESGTEKDSQSKERGATKAAPKITGLEVNGGNKGLTAYEQNTINPITSDGSKVKYKLVYTYDKDWINWGVVKDFEEPETKTWQPERPGKCEIYVDAQDSAGKITSTKFNVEVLNNFDFTIEGISPKMETGKPYTIKVKPTGKTDRLKYKFVNNIKDGDEWQILTGMQNLATYTFTPKKAGKNVFYVDVMDKLGNTLTKTVNYEVNYGWDFEVSGLSSTSKAGQGYTIKVNATGNTDGLRFKFVNHNHKTDEWTIMQQLSSSSTYNYVPKQVGKNTLYVDVEDKNGNWINATIDTVTDYGFDFTITGIPEKSEKGAKYTVKVNATGDTSGLQYKYVNNYKDKDKWYILQGMSSASTYNYVFWDLGKNEFYVDVQDRFGNVYTKTFTTNTSYGWTYDSVTVPKQGKVGEAVTLSAKCTGKTDLKYKFVAHHHATDTWDVVRPMALGNTFNFVPNKPGRYDIYIDVEDANGNIITNKSDLTVDMHFKYDKLSVDKNNVVQGENVKITATTSGNTSDLQYKFVFNHKDSGEWDINQPGSSNAFNFIPKKPGSYDIYVDIIDKYNNYTTKIIELKVVPDWTYIGVKASKTDVEIGETITITPEVNGNTQGLKYKFVYSYMNWSQWDVIKPISSVNSASFKIDKPGHYNIYVDITDPSGYTVTKDIRIVSNGGAVKVLKDNWFDSVNAGLPRGGNYTVVDVLTGKRFTVKRWAGSNHADMEPLTVKDTAILKDVYGGSWSWARRPVVVINGTKAYAGSMNGMPHGVTTIDSNGFAGHICIHFYMSRTHGTNRVDPDHKAAVEKAAAIGSVKL